MSTDNVDSRDAKPIQKVDGAKGLQTPVDSPLAERSTEELVSIIERFKEDLQWYVDERNKLTAQLAEAREAHLELLKQYREQDDSLCLSITRMQAAEDERDQLKAQLDRAKRDLRVVTGNLESADANHKVMAAQLAGDKERQFQEWQLLHEMCIETFAGDVNSCPDCGRLVMCHKHSRLSEEIELIDKAVRTKLAALQSPSPCVNGCPLRFWETQAGLDPDSGDDHLTGPLYQPSGHCLLCDAYTQGQEKMRDAAELRVAVGAHDSRCASLRDQSHINADLCDCGTKMLMDDIREIPVTRLENGQFTAPRS